MAKIPKTIAASGFSRLKTWTKDNIAIARLAMANSETGSWFSETVFSSEDIWEVFLKDVGILVISTSVKQEKIIIKNAYKNGFLKRALTTK